MEFWVIVIRFCALTAVGSEVTQRKNVDVVLLLQKLDFNTP
jgi:hypothetical protein